MNKFKNPFVFATVVVIAMVIVIVAHGWTNPSQNPPGGAGALTASSTLVGINTANPLYQLDVAGTFRATATSTFSGNVGIGTTSPGAKLMVETQGTGNVRFENTLSTATRGPWMWLFEDDGTVADDTGKGLRIVGRRPSTGTGGLFIVENVNIGELLRVQDNGNVGIGTTSPGSLLTVAGPISTNAPTTKTAAYTMTATDSSLIFNGAASIILTLQAASSFPGRILYVKTIAAFPVVSASSNVVLRATATAGDAILSGTAGAWAMLQSDGTNWVVMAGN